MASVIYLTRINFFSDKAHVHTISKTCEAISLAGNTDFTLVSTDDSLANEEEKKQFFKIHGISHHFKIISLNSFSNLFKNSSNFFIYNLSTFFANISLICFVWRNRKNTDCVYFRDHLILPVVLFSKYFLGKKIVYESHYILTKRFGQWLTEKSVSVSDGIVAIAIALKDYYLNFNKNIIVSFCASSDKEKFENQQSKNFYRNKLELPNNRYYLVYTGNIDVTGNGDSYGVEDVVSALPFMQNDVCFIAVGKKTKGVHPLEKLAESLHSSSKFKCVSWVVREKVKDYILAADALIIPKSGAKPGNSPTKMFEYLATGRPIIAADTLPMREVLHNGSNSILVDYENSKAWSGAVVKLRQDKEYAKAIVEKACKDADLYTWKKRGLDISSFIKSIC